MRTLSQIVEAEVLRTFPGAESATVTVDAHAEAIEVTVAHAGNLVRYCWDIYADYDGLVFVSTHDTYADRFVAMDADDALTTEWEAAMAAHTA
ncbi:MAG: hypothetical protein EHM78_02355 [Myxococcaceae bacterium]|nr:MAG: hypothetical protein EHM78_02355 [Myxococcaceae bacterium]